MTAPDPAALARAALELADELNCLVPSIVSGRTCLDYAAKHPEALRAGIDGLKLCAVCCAKTLARALLDAHAEAERLRTGLRNLKAAGEQAEDARSLHDLLTNEIDALINRRTREP